MSKSPHSVALVVDPEFGERLVALSDRLHVWVVNTPSNRGIAERIWRALGGVHSLGRGVTTFDTDAQASPSEVAADQLSSIDLHHGEYSQSAPWSLLEVYGAEPTSMLTAALREFGLVEIIQRPGFFIARRPCEGAGSQALEAGRP